MKLLRIALTTSLAAGLAGCASTTSLRSLARQDAAFVGSLNTGTGEFLAAQNGLNAQGELRIRDLGNQAAASADDMRRVRATWSNRGDSARAQMLDSAVSVSAEDIVAGMKSQSPAAAVPIAPVSGGYDASIKALAHAAEKPGTSAQLSEMIAFGQTAFAALDGVLDKATKATGQAVTTAGAKDVTMQQTATVK